MESFDFLIVGAGSAGSVLAARLSADPNLKVGLIEAGGTAQNSAIADPLNWPLLQGSEIDWCYSTLPQKGTAGRSHPWPRGRVVGGSSCLNAMAHLRGHPSDFDGWAAKGCYGWSYRELLPYFIRSETSEHLPSPYHGGDGPLRLLTIERPHPITQAYLAAGADCGFPPIEEHNGPSMTGPTLNTLTIVDGRRQSTADAYLTPALSRDNLQLRCGSVVAALLFQGGNRCHGCEVLTDGKRETLTAERGIILAAGSIGSPAILLSNGIGPADDLRGHGIEVRLDLPAVGENLHDHLLSGGNLYRAKRPVPASLYQHSESLMYLPGAGSTPAPGLVLACVVMPVTTECFAAPAAGEAYTLMYGFTHPKSRGRIRLTSADPLAPPLIDPNYLAAPADRAAYLEALDLAQQIGHAKAFDDWRDGEVLPGPAVRSKADRMDFLERAALTHHHPVGTCRMGVGDDAVVTPRLQVKGIENLFVVDASVMPEITTGPVNAAVIAIAERASDLLLGHAPLPAVSIPPLYR